MTPHLPSMSDQEMNVACAEVLGYVLERDGLWHFYDHDPEYPGEIICSDLPSFTTSADACLLLLEHLRKTGRCLAIWQQGEAFTVVFYENHTDNPSHSAKDKELPRAITKAALLATGRAQN